MVRRGDRTVAEVAWRPRSQGLTRRAPRLACRGGSGGACVNGTAAGVDVGLPSPSAQRVPVQPHLRADPQDRRVQRQARPAHEPRHEPLDTLAQLTRILPRRWNRSTLPWLRCLHQSRGASVIPGRSSIGACAWLAGREQMWLDQIRWATLDLSGPWRLASPRCSLTPPRLLTRSIS